MKPLSDWNVVFISEDNTEILATDWEQYVINGYVYFKTVCVGLEISVLLRNENELFLKTKNTGIEPITGFLGIRFLWSEPEKGYTVIPGVYYNGNYQEELHNIAVMHLPERPVFQASLSAASIPAVFAWDGQKTAYHYAASLSSFAGWNGVELDGKRNYITFYAPTKEDRKYKSCRFSSPRVPYTWGAGDIISLKVKRSLFEADSVCDIFEYIWNEGCRLENHPAQNTPRIAEKKAAELVRDWIYAKHCVVSKSGVPMLLNALEDINLDYPEHNIAEWYTMIGWCSGTMTALPLFKFGGKYREYAVKYVDFLTMEGFTPAGTKYAIFDSSHWMDESHPQYHKKYKHCRFYCDFLYYLGKCIAHEKNNGHFHENWEKVFHDGIDILVHIWKKNHDFGLYWNTDEEEVVIETKGTGAGAFALLALTEGVLHYPNNEHLKNTLLEAAALYYDRCVLTGRCNGGPADIIQADDSESIAALTDAFVRIYLTYKIDTYKTMAVHAAHLFASWVLCYCPTFPGGSTLEGINVCGGVIANVQNRHVGPGICTNSAKFVRDLGKITGDSRWEALYYRIKAAAINCISMYTGEFFGKDFDKPFGAGMVTEQINVTDALSPSGETWRVSASWPATAILLGYWDQ